MSIPARRAWPLAAWILFVLLVSLLPLPLKQSLQTHGRFHNSAHFFAFLITVLLICWNRRSNGGIAAAWAGAIVIALFVEGAQTAIYHNLFEWDDVLADSLGVVTGGALFLVYRANAQSRGKKVICNPAVKSCRGGPTTGRK